MSELPRPKNNIVSRYFHGTEQLFNKIVTFISAIFLSAIFFLFLVKLLNSWGIYLGLALSVALNVYLKKRYKKDHFYNIFNNGLITFNIITTVTLIVILVVFFSAVQNALN